MVLRPACKVAFHCKDDLGVLFGELREAAQPLMALCPSSAFAVFRAVFEHPLTVFVATGSRSAALWLCKAVMAASLFVLFVNLSHEGLLRQQLLALADLFFGDAKRAFAVFCLFRHLAPFAFACLNVPGRCRAVIRV